jgi:hypothetical protein
MMNVPYIHPEHGRSTGNEHWTGYNWKRLIETANMGIRAAQQAHLTGSIENTGDMAKTYAMETTKTFLASMGLEEIDVDAIDKIIEGLFNTMAGELKDQLVNAGLKV